MPPARKLIKNTVGLLIVLCIAFFFYRAFERNWASLQAQNITPNYVALVASAAMIVVLLLTGTYGWQLAINSLSEGRKLKFLESIATVNSSGLTKYVPGRVWSYALQMYWLASLGVRMSLVLYSNLLNHLISLISCVISGLLCLLWVVPPKLFWPLLAVLVLVVLADLLGMLFHGPFFRWLLPLLGRLVRRDIQHIEFPFQLLLRLHAVHFVGAVLSGVCIYWMCLAIGYPITRQETPLVVASALLAEVAGTLALIVPGGLGVREGVMYLLLGGASNNLLALVLPVASRLITMVVDLLLGSVSFIALRRLHPPSAAAESR